MSALFRWSSQKSICVVGANELGVSIAVVIASKCPNIGVKITDPNVKEVNEWVENRITFFKSDLKQLLEKCTKENLKFTTDVRDAIHSSEIIVLFIDDLDLENPNLSALKELEEVARVIADVSNSAKVIVQKSPNVPVGTCGLLETIINENKSKKSSFQFLAMPEFFTSVSPINYLLNPDFIILGHEKSSKGIKAAKALEDIYTQWVPEQKIKKMTCIMAEMAKVAINAARAQNCIAKGTIAVICEQAKNNYREIEKASEVLNKSKQAMDLGFGLENMHLYRDVLRLIDITQQLRFIEVENYWKEVLKLNEKLEKRFFVKILKTFYYTLDRKKIAFFGITSKGNGKITSELPTVRLASKLLEENAEVVLFDMNVQVKKEEIVEMLKSCGATNANDLVTVQSDPYKAAKNAQGIIFATSFWDLKCLDFNALYREMSKPRYLFDWRNVLDHENLSKIGFKIITVGREANEEDENDIYY